MLLERTFGSNKKVIDEVLPTNRLLKIPMYLSCLVGIWPIILVENPHLRRLYDIFAAILYYYYLEYIFRAYYQITVLLRADNLNVEEILGNVCITLIYTVSMFRLKAFSSDEVKALFNTVIETENDISKNPDDKIRKLYDLFVKSTTIYNILFCFNGWVVSFLYFIHPFLIELPEVTVNNKTITLRVLPLSTWWPFDIQEHYWFAYCWNIFDGTLGSSIVINSDMLTFSLIVFALSQLHILDYKVEQFGKNISKNLSEKEKELIERNEFIELVKEHQKLISYVDTFNKSMKYVMLFDFLQCSVQMATITLQLLVMEINVQNIIFVGEFLLTMLIRLVIYYFNANEIIYQSQKLAITAWKANWCDSSKDVKHMFMFFIARCQRPIRLQIGPFAIMSLETFITILKATYSYMMLFINTSDE
ncbi:odorant receptor 30a-like [Anthonomus grandis grandis]|uniref:odorant receptor 30a-like n=1 Tax=Anthonomus grandis grandis TaxID=2921223 RepID=UPI002165DEA9|nr:odorant receptor 30a-like [Anthonomus grandis grandis]